MKRIVLFLFSFGLFCANGQTGGYEIKVTFRPYKNKYIYLGHYFGAKQYPIIDSVLLDNNSVGIFKGNKILGRGIYLLGYPDKNGFFEILMDFNQRFSITVDSTQPGGVIRFQNSPYNTEFLAYQKFMSEKGQSITDTKNRLAVAKNKADSSVANDQLKDLDKSVAAYRDSLIKKNKNGVLGRLLKGMEEPEVPPASQHPGGKYDTLYAYNYYKSRYWEGVDFWDDLFARTTFFEGKLDKYFENVVAPSADSVIKEIDRMLAYASISPDMNRFLLVKFINRYYTQKYMWEDRVFVHLYEKYLSGKQYPWLSANGRKMITDRAYSLMANIFGSPAADIELPDSTGKNISLYSIQSPYTIVCFWDATCGHCQETLPKIDSIYNAKWKASGVQIYSVSKETTGTLTNWKTFVKDHNLLGWTNVFYSKAMEESRIKNNIPGYSQLYDVQTFPTLYLLDKDKRIIAKKLTYLQMDDILDLKLKKGN
jgi:hypothetical protein